MVENEQVPGTLLVTRALLEFGDLGEFEFDRRFTAEDVNQHLDLELVFVELDDLAAEVGEGSFFDSYRLAHFVELAGTGLLLASRSRCVVIGLDLQERLDFAAWQR